MVMELQIGTNSDTRAQTVFHLVDKCPEHPVADAAAALAPSTLSGRQSTSRNRCA